MANVRDLKVRIKSVGNIRQITRAMEMVATTKLRRFQDRAIASRPYTEEIEGLVKRLAAKVGGENHPLFGERAGDRTSILVVTSDRGLCGAYNSNVFGALGAYRAGEGASRDLELSVVGKKGATWLGKRGLDVAELFDDPPLDKLGFADAASIARVFVGRFLAGETDEVRVLYTRFVSMTRYEPTCIRFLPVDAAGGGGLACVEPLLEPDAETIVDSLVPKYLETRMFNALLESLTSEFASRRVSMKNATDAATDMQGELKLKYNRARQERITKELLEIVGGAEALS